jgi:cytochrome oxidase Cu insertion factor (SCO1/SenC/PrrC family)
MYKVKQDLISGNWVVIDPEGNIYAHYYFKSDAKELAKQINKIKKEEA